MALRFAFAVNDNNRFENKHFGDADKYIIYKEDNDNIVFVSEEINKFKLLDEEREHGSKRKGNAIINSLKDKEVNVIVSTRFGKNIKMVNEHFIPVKITLEQPDEVINTIIKHLNWIKDEWESKSSGFKLFIIKSGILKLSLDKYK
jgi:predicted Fe-Mo cluster-binding NifX family protein